MATSAIGPAFLTQTAVFTAEFYASFAFAILISIIIDIGAQINIWRVLVVTGLRGQEVSNKVMPGLGTLISILIAFGGLAFNIGNIAGAGLGLNAMFGLDIKWGAAITAIFSILIFVSKVDKNHGCCIDDFRCCYDTSSCICYGCFKSTIWRCISSHICS